MIVALPFTVLTSCNSDDNSPGSSLSKAYELASLANPAISGTANFIQNSDDSVTVELSLTGTTDGESYPAHIHYNTAAKGGTVGVQLTSVDGTTGTSTTTFSELTDMTAATYADMIGFDGYINIHNSVDVNIIDAQGNIGSSAMN